MAFSGLHVACGYVGGRGVGNRETIPLVGPALWSRTYAANAAATADVAAPPVDGDLGSPCFSISTSVDAWVATGANPDPTAANGARRLVRAGSDVHLFCKSGDKFAWTPA